LRLKDWRDTPQNLLPVTRFQDEELEMAIQRMEFAMKTLLPSPVPADTDASTSIRSCQDVLGIEQHVPTFHRSHVNFDEFRKYWRQGIPVVITHLELQGHWDPESFIELFDQVRVTVQDCETGVTQSKMLPEFFSNFGKPKEEAEIWKVKVHKFSCSLSSLLNYGQHSSIFDSNALNSSIHSWWLFHSQV
jgi:hypothetical protein